MQVDVKPVSELAWAASGNSRGFWTKRRRTAMALTAIMALVAGIALAYKLFEQEVPNNVVRDASNFDFTIQAKDGAAGETSYHDVPGDGTATVQNSIFLQGTFLDPSVNVDQFPGDSRTSNVLIRNTNAVPARDASFSVYVRNDTLRPIQVFRYCGPGAHPASLAGGCAAGSNTDADPGNDYLIVNAADADWATFVGYWSLTVNKQMYDTSSDPIQEALVCGGEADCIEQAAGSSGSYAPTNCQGSPLTTIKAATPCDLGIVRSAGSESGHILLGGDTTDDRDYLFSMAEKDTGTDQSKYKGWRVNFTLQFAARVPAAAEGDRYSTSIVPGVV